MKTILPQHLINELAFFMDANHIQRLTINKGRDMEELKIEASTFSAVEVKGMVRNLDD